jgi:hypothetical protein
VDVEMKDQTLIAPSHTTNCFWKGELDPLTVEEEEGEIMEDDDEDEGEILEDDCTNEVIVPSDQTSFHIWTGKLVYLPERDPKSWSESYDARRKMHVSSGNTTFPCPSDLLKFLERRPLITYNGKTYCARHQDYSSSDAPCDSSDDDSEDSGALFKDCVLGHHKRFRMP